MFFSPDDTPLTQEEKINFIYKELRKHQTERVINLVWKWAWRGIFFVGMLYLYLNPSSIFGLVQNMTGM